jgi:hypothetical protein
MNTGLYRFIKRKRFEFRTWRSDTRRRLGIWIYPEIEEKEKRVSRQWEDTLRLAEKACEAMKEANRVLDR